MKRKILTIITIESIFLMTLTGCVNFSYRNPVKSDYSTSYVAESPDGSQVEMTQEEAEEIKETQEELQVAARESEEESETESEEESGTKTENSVVREDKSPQESTAVDDVLEENTTQSDYFDSTPFEQRYWVIFNEGYRNDRIEASAFDSTLPADQLAIIWKSTLEINDPSGSDGCAQYYLDDNGEWIYMRNYHRLSNKATNVLASNLDVLDSNGNVIIFASSYSMIDWDEDEKNEEDGTNDDIITENIPEDAVEYNGHYYYLYEDGIASTYEEAAKYCNSKGGYLATLTSQEENYFVYSYILQQGFKSAYFGLSDSASEGNWEWCTGEPLDYTNWHSGEPNNEYSNEDYGLFYYKYSDGSWNDGDFNRKTVNDGSAFICEWGDFSS